MNKKKGLIIAIVVLIVGTCGYFLISKNNNTPANDCVDCAIKPSTNTTSVKKAKNFNIVYSGETKKYNAYDFILEKMEQAQYWTYEQHEPVYNFTYNYDYEKLTNSKPKVLHNIKNATGFILYDEDTASFTRGFEGRIIINFSENKAICDDYFNPNPDDENDIKDILTKDKNLEYPETIYEFNIANTDSNNRYFLFDVDDEILNTMTFYNNIFDELDIPLLNMPKGTLKSYKNKTIDVPIELIELKYSDRWCDDLIHSPFDERVGFDWCWENNKDNEWLNDYKDVFTKQSPEPKENLFLPNLTTGANVAYYAPIFLAFESKNYSNYYLHEQWNSDTANKYENFSGAYLTYYLKPLYKYVFGFNGVYFYDHSKPLGAIDKNNDLLFGDEFFADALNWYYRETDIGFVMPIYNSGDERVGNQYQITGLSFNVDDLNNYLNSVIDKNNGTSCFGTDYCRNLYLLYAPAMQRELGLR